LGLLEIPLNYKSYWITSLKLSHKQLSYKSQCSAAMCEYVKAQTGTRLVGRVVGSQSSAGSLNLLTQPPL